MCFKLREKYVCELLIWCTGPPSIYEQRQGFVEAQLLLAQKRLYEVTSASEGPSWFMYTYLSQLILSFLFQI